MIVGMVATFLKVLAFRSFQIFHETSMRREAIAFLLPP
jgi:Tfp pilus assembly protein PilE